MLGQGKYKANINHMFYNGEAFFEIEYDDGKLELDIDLPEGGIDIPDVEITEFFEEENTIIAKAKLSIIPGKEVDINLTFDGDRCNGYIKAPFVGKIKIKDAVKVS